MLWIESRLGKLLRMMSEAFKKNVVKKKQTGFFLKTLFFSTLKGSLTEI